MGAANATAGKEVTGPGTTELMEAVVERSNMLAALHQVESNKGAAGVDDMTVDDLRAYLKEQWLRIRERLLSGSYEPRPVRRVEIPKPDGKGMRKLGIPTVVDRLIQQALHQVMESLTWFLEQTLRLKVNREKSAVDRPWRRKFLGYSMTFHMKTLLKVAPQSVKRIRIKFKELFRVGVGRNLERFIREDLNPVIRGWGNYFHLSETQGTFEELDGWLRRKLRCMLWRQWKRPKTRFARLRARGLAEIRAWKSASNGRGRWWNSGASHMNEAFPKRYFDNIGLLSLLTTVRFAH